MISVAFQLAVVLDRASANTSMILLKKLSTEETPFDVAKLIDDKVDDKVA